MAVCFAINNTVLCKVIDQQFIYQDDSQKSETVKRLLLFKEQIKTKTKQNQKNKTKKYLPC